MLNYKGKTSAPFKTNDGRPYSLVQILNPPGEVEVPEVQNSTSTVHELQISNQPCRVKNLTISNVGGGEDPVYVMLFDTDGDGENAPEAGDVPSLPAIPLYPGGFVRLSEDIFNNGLYVFQSSTLESLTPADAEDGVLQIRSEFYLT